jgi:GT2 family glycosyltransferase
MLVRKSSLIAVGGFDARFIDEGGDRDLAARMRAAGMTLARCSAGFVWRCGRITLGEFLRQRIRDGRAEAMLAIAAIGSFGAIAQAWARRHYSAASSSAEWRGEGRRASGCDGEQSHTRGPSGEPLN